MDGLTPTRQDWKALDCAFEACQMELSEFQAYYPNLNRRQLAKVANCTVDVVDRWFTKGPRLREPSEYHKLRFAIAHWVWSGASPPPLFEEMRRLQQEFENNE